MAETCWSKTFDGSAEIIYLIGEDFYDPLHQSCMRANWIGIEAEKLVGAKCVFSSESENATDSVVAGLCPPPDLFGTADLSPSPLREFLISARSTRPRP